MFRRHSNERSGQGFPLHRNSRRGSHNEERSLVQYVRSGFRRAVQDDGGYTPKYRPRDQRKSSRGKEVVVGFLDGSPIRDFASKQRSNRQNLPIEYVPTPVLRLVDQEESLSMTEEEYAPLRKPVRILNRQMSMIDE